MTLMIELPAEVESRLEEEAARRGVSVAEYARALLESHVLPHGAKIRSSTEVNAASQTRADSKEEPLPFYATATPEEWVKAFDEWVERYGRKVPNLPPEAYDREHMYGDRG
jgi:hypothetical protein